MSIRDGSSSIAYETRTYSHPTSLSMAIRSSFSDIGGSRMTPRSFCRSTKCRTPVDELAAVAVAGMDDEFVVRSAQAVQRAFHHVDDVLRVRVVVDETDQERLAESEPARLRIGNVAVAVHDRLDSRARVLVHHRGAIDDARDRLLRYAGEARDVVDGDAAAADLRLRRATLGARPAVGSALAPSFLSLCQPFAPA